MVYDSKYGIGIIAFLLRCSIALALVCGYARTAPCQAIIDAVKKGDTIAVRRMLTANAAQTVSAMDGGHGTALQWCAVFGRTEIAQLLIDNGAEVDTRDDHKWTPLHHAAYEGQLGMIDLLIQRGANISALSEDGNMPIHWAAHAGRAQAVTYLMLYRSDVDAPNQGGGTPLAVAAWYGQLDTCKLLVAAGADIHNKNQGGVTPIDESVRAGKSIITEYLKSYDAELQLQAARDERKKANPGSIRTSYANWQDQKAVTKTVYHQDFAQDEIGSEWSTTPLPGAAQAPLRVSSTPRGHRRYFGDFGSQAVHLNLRALPAHHEVAVTFDLYILNSWDGNDARVGPDIWSLGVEDGPTLLNTTFANTNDGRKSVKQTEQLKNVKIQAYPDSYPGGHSPIYTGAEEVNTLGYMFNLDGIVVPMDAVYKMRYTFGNSESDITLNFAAHGLEPLNNESWGIANVEVSVDFVPAPVAIVKPSVVSPHPTLSASKPNPTATRYAATKKPSISMRKAVSTKRKPTAAGHKSAAVGKLHEKKKPLTP